VAVPLATVHEVVGREGWYGRLTFSRTFEGDVELLPTQIASE
jgi:hypothetical protein